MTLVREAMVVCPQPEAAETGIEILRAGGNAVDAAIACALAQSVVDPLMCGIAGFGSMGLFLPDKGAHEYLDFHAPAPRAATPDMWDGLLEEEARDGFGFRIKGRHNDLGYQSIAIPTALRAFEQAHRTHGRLPWSEIVAPAIHWAREGFFVRPAMHAFWSDDGDMGRTSNQERLRFSESGRHLYCRPDGSPRRIGETLRNLDYAHTLEAIAQGGADVFYHGEIAERIIQDMAAHGGLIDAQDLRNYQPQRRQPLFGQYRGYTIATNPPPGGGAMLLQMLNILSHFDLPAIGHNTPEYLRIVCETMKRATTDKDRYIGDPAFIDIPLERMLGTEIAKQAADEIMRGVVAHVPRATSPNPVSKDTTHLSIVDADGNCVTMTHSLGMPSGVITSGLGFMYNGCMSVFDPRPGRTGSIAPGKARFSSMCPTIVLRDGHPYIVTGSPGGTQIAMGILHSLVNVIDFNMPIQTAVSQPRFSSTSDTIDVCNRIPRYITRPLVEQGYEIVRNPFGYTIGWIHAIEIRPDGRLEGGADPGRDGVALRTEL